MATQKPRQFKTVDTIVCSGVVGHPSEPSRRSLRKQLDDYNRRIEVVFKSERRARNDYGAALTRALRQCESSLLHTHRITLDQLQVPRGQREREPEPESQAEFRERMRDENPDYGW